MKTSGFGKIRATFLIILCWVFGLPYGSIPTAGAGDTQCKTQTCFSEQVSRCEPARFDTRLAAHGQARYKIIGPRGGGCAIDFKFLKNSNSALVGPLLSFVVDPQQEFEPQLKEAVADCLQGKKSKYQCSGPLWEMAGGGGEVAMRIASEPPCGVVIEDDGPSLYPMPLDGRWGYVTLDGEWAIEPRWVYAQPFSEGRAVVNSNGRWGVIDREGNYVLEPVLRGNSPLQPYSQGCATANVQKDGSPHPFFVDRDGRFWLDDGLPEELSDKNVWEFGSYSGGLVWFQAMGEGLRESYGWIDSQGKVVLEDDYTGAGEFVNGLAPAASGGKYNWAYIDTNGNPVLPTKWKYQKARAFSEGLAAVKINVFESLYFNTDGIAIMEVNFRKPRGSGAGRKTSAKIERAGDFHDGLAAILPHGLFADNELIFIHPDGSEAFAPHSDLGLTLCNIGSNLPQFHDGLLRLLVANRGEQCGDPGFSYPSKAHNDMAHYVYLDTTGKVVLEQPWREGDSDVKP